MNLDKVGIIAAVTCAIHCSLLPFVMVIIPTFGISLFANHEIEWIFLTISLILNLVSLCFGFRKHKSLKAFAYAGIGFSSIVICNMLRVHYKEHNHIEFDLYNVILMTGGLLIAFSHHINNKLCQRCNVCKVKGCSH